MVMSRSFTFIIVEFSKLKVLRQCSPIKIDKNTLKKKSKSYFPPTFVHFGKSTANILSLSLNARDHAFPVFHGLNLNCYSFAVYHINIRSNFISSIKFVYQ